MIVVMTMIDLRLVIMPLMIMITLTLSKIICVNINDGDGDLSYDSMSNYMHGDFKATACIDNYHGGRQYITKIKITTNEDAIAGWLLPSWCDVNQILKTQ